VIVRNKHPDHLHLPFGVTSPGAVSGHCTTREARDAIGTGL
jgi:hypothetical protein